MEQRWIWQYLEYPNFSFDEKAINEISLKASLEQGKLLGLSFTLSDSILQNSLIDSFTEEVISSAAIEGESLKRDSVRKSVAQRLGFASVKYDKTDHHEKGMVDVIVDACIEHQKPLSLERIHGWHNSLFPTGYSGLLKINVAKFRDEGPMKVVSEKGYNEIVRYEAFPKEKLDTEIECFIDWFNKEPETLIKASIAHLWFVVIHPYDDGNGRIARALSDLVLSRIESASSSKIYSISSNILKNRKKYYEALDATTGFLPIRIKDDGIDIGVWLNWFINNLRDSFIDAQKNLDYVIQKTRFWDEFNNCNLNFRQVKVINKILDVGVEKFEGGINRQKYSNIAKTSTATATRDLTKLEELGCIQKVDGTQGKNTRYEVAIPVKL